jgi:sigma-B regulation protein RsbU (phosphoserine phosphatase)
LVTQLANETSILATVVAARHAQFAALANAWLAMGATGFAIWQDGQPLAVWPDTSAEHTPSLTAPITLNTATIGELRVYGLAGAGYEVRLKVDASLAGHLVGLEHELESMTSELIDLQDQQLALYDLNQSTRSHLDLDQMLPRIVQEAARLVKADGAFLVLSEAGTSPKIAQFPPGLMDEVVDFFQTLQITGRDLVLNKESAAVRFPPAIRNLLFTPIMIRESLSVGMALLNKTDGEFNAPDYKLARAIADQAGAQIENVLLYQETLEQAKLKTELDLAARIQLRLLPQKLPRVAGLDLAAASRPALQVGGDFYDLIKQPAQPFVFVVGDVSGKGMSAALLMAMSRTVIRSRAHALGRRLPDELMNCVNEDLYDDFTDVGMFATAFIAQYNHELRELTFVNAGHSPVIYCSAEGDAELLQADGTAIGVLPISLCENQVRAIQPGDLLIVATDGFSEARNGTGELFGYDRLLRLTEALRDRPAQEIADAFFSAVERFAAGHPQDDDQTLVVVKGVAS